MRRYPPHLPGAAATPSTLVPARSPPGTLPGWAVPAKSEHPLRGCTETQGAGVRPKPPFTCSGGDPPPTVGKVSSAPAPSPGGPPPPGRWQRLRARWADRHALPRFGYWLLSRGAIVLGVCSALYVLNGFLIGWGMVPAIIGATAGYVITEQIQAHHARELSDGPCWRRPGGHRSTRPTRPGHGYGCCDAARDRGSRSTTAPPQRCALHG